MIHQQYDLVPNLSSLQNVLAGRLGDWGLLKSVISLVVASRSAGGHDRAGTSGRP